MNQHHASNLETHLVETWKTLAAERFLGEMRSQEVPWVIIVTGQPAAGKSVVIDSLQSGPLNGKQSVLIDPSELAELHPARPVLLQNGEYEAVDSLRSDAAQLASSLLDRAVEARSHLVLACTFDGSASAEGLVGYLHENGYAIHVLAVAVSPITTRQDYVKRRQVSMPISRGDGAQDVSYHDSMYERFLDATSWLEESTECELTLIDRTGNVLAQKSSDQVLAAGKCMYILTALSDDDESVAPITSKVPVKDASLYGEMSHPRFRASSSTERREELEVVVPQVNFTNVPEKERKRIEQRLQFVQTLQRLAEAERHDTY